MLDLTECAEKTGKDAANDLSNHRMTLPLLRALQCGSVSELQTLKGLMSSDTAGDQQQLSREPLVKEGIESAQATATAFVRRAVASLHRMPASPARSVLEMIAWFATERSV